MHREERERAAAEQRAAREAEAAQAADEAGTTTSAQPHSRNPMQSGEPVEPVAERDGWLEEDRHAYTDFVRFPPRSGEASAVEATAGVVRTLAVSEAHAP